MMELRLLLPGRVLISAPASKVTAEGREGSFCLLPDHIDFVAELVPGLLCYVDSDDHECFVAVDEGVLVKRGREVLVSSRHAVLGDSIDSLRSTVRSEFLAIDSRERNARSALARLERDLFERFVQLGETVS